MLFQLHQYTKKAMQQWRQSYNFLLICYQTSKKKKKKFIQPRIKIIQLTLFFSFLLFYLTYRALSHHCSQAQFSQALISLISQALISPRHRHPSPHHKKIVLVKKKMYKYNLGLKKSLVNIRRLFAIMWWRQEVAVKKLATAATTMTMAVVAVAGGCDCCLLYQIYYFIVVDILF